MAPSNTNPKTQHNWKKFSRIMVLSMFKPAAAFILLVESGRDAELLEGSEDWMEVPGLVLDLGPVWVGDLLVESGWGVDWIAELLEGSEDWMEGFAVVDWVAPPQLRSAAVVATVHWTKAQPITCVTAFQSSSRPDVKSLQALVISETITPGNFERSSTIAPLWMSLKTLTAPVIVASATLRISVGNVKKILRRFEIAPMTSSGRFRWS